MKGGSDVFGSNEMLKIIHFRPTLDQNDAC